MSAISSALFATSFSASELSSTASANKQNKKDKADAGDATTTQGQPLTPQQKQQVNQLKKIDTDVRQHEAAHLAVAGGYARSGIVLDFSTGPDGKQYAVGGHVDIDTAPVKGDPRATIDKLRTVQAAALAPADPSGQDRAVASAAAAGVARAEQELSQKQSTAASNAPASSPHRESYANATSPEDAQPKGVLLDTFA
jgi:hypothetical protein